MSCRIVPSAESAACVARSVQSVVAVLIAIAFAAFAAARFASERSGSSSGGRLIQTSAGGMAACGLPRTNRSGCMR